MFYKHNHQYSFLFPGLSIKVAEGCFRICLRRARRYAPRFRVWLRRARLRLGSEFQRNGVSMFGFALRPT